MESRIDLPAIGEMSQRQESILQSIIDVRGSADGPFLAWLHSPNLADLAQNLGAFCRYGTQLDLAESELLILCVAAHFECLGEQQIHEPIAIEAGLSEEQVAQIREKKFVRFQAKRKQLLWEFVGELLNQNKVNDSTFMSVHDEFGTQSLVESVSIIGYYSFVAMTLNAFDMKL